MAAAAVLAMLAPYLPVLTVARPRTLAGAQQHKLTVGLDLRSPDCAGH